VELKELPHLQPVRNQSGFFCFEAKVEKDETSTLAGEFTLIAEPDPVVANWFFMEPPTGKPWSFEFTRKVTLPMKDPANPNEPTRWPQEPIRWAPNPSYPFPENSTLVRGVVQGPGQDPPKLPGIVVRATYKQTTTDPQATRPTIDHTIATQSDEKGEFVLFFQALPEPTQKITVTAVKNGQQIEQSPEIKEGKTTSKVVFAFP